MLPDGAERQPEDWTIFFLNQRPFNTIAPVLALELLEAQGGDTDGQEQEKAPELLYVLNLVRTKLDKTVRRCVIDSELRDISRAVAEERLSRRWLYVLAIPSSKSSRYLCPAQ